MRSILSTLAVLAIPAAMMSASASAAVCVPTMTPAQATAVYTKAVDAAQQTLQASYSAAMDAYNQGVAAAQAKRDHDRAALPGGEDKSGEALNQVIATYNRTVTQLEAIYWEVINGAKFTYALDVAQAQAAYNTALCR